MQISQPLITDSIAGGCGASTRIEMALGRSPDDVWQAVLNTVHQWREVRTIVSTPEETLDPQISVLLRARASLIKHSAAPEKREAIPRIAAVRPIKAFKFTCERELNRDVHASGDQSVATVIGWRSAATASGDWSAAAATGNRSAATATGYQSAATATGWRSAATASGDQVAATATGYEGKVRGKEGCALFLVERSDSMEIVSVWSGIAGRDGIKPDTYYTLKSGQPVETD